MGDALDLIVDPPTRCVSGVSGRSAAREIEPLVTLPRLEGLTADVPSLILSDSFGRSAASVVEPLITLPCPEDLAADLPAFRDDGSGQSAASAINQTVVLPRPEASSIDLPAYLGADNTGRPAASVIEHLVTLPRPVEMVSSNTHMMIQASPPATMATCASMDPVAQKRRSTRLAANEPSEFVSMLDRATNLKRHKLEGVGKKAAAQAIPAKVLRDKYGKPLGPFLMSWWTWPKTALRLCPWRMLLTWPLRVMLT